jgi:hypothetical protein
VNVGRNTKKPGAGGAVLYVAIERASLVKRRLAAFREHHVVENIPLGIVSGHIDLRTSRDSAEVIIEHAEKLGACDTTVKVESFGTYRAAMVDKANDGPDREQVTFDLKSVELHYDQETNTTTTAPVVIPAEASLASAPKGPNLSANQRSMLNILEDAGQGGLTQDEWFDRAREMGLGKNRIATLYDLRKALKDKRLVYEFNDRWFLSN